MQNNNQSKRRAAKKKLREKKIRRFLNTPEAAEYIGRHRSSLDKWRSENIVLPYYRDGMKILYSKDDLDAYLASHRVEPVAYACSSATR